MRYYRGHQGRKQEENATRHRMGTGGQCVPRGPPYLRVPPHPLRLVFRDPLFRLFSFFSAEFSGGLPEAFYFFRID